MFKEFDPQKSSPNWVSSLADKNDKTHYIEAFDLGKKDKFEVFIKLRSILLDELKAQVITESQTSLDVFVLTSFLRFRDDLSFVLTDTSIEIWSRSRVGHYDFEANRKRIEGIRNKLA